ncbi:hypothetical protein PIROE2DRAFT_16238, partial [Piromyces sp. E2]
KLFDGNALFLKYWKIYSNPIYKVSPLPGIKEGISGSTAGGSNIGISIYSKGEKRIAAVKVLQYISSKEVQKEEVVLNNNLLSAIPSLYDDPEVCEKIDCDFFKSIQYIPRPIQQIDNYDEYSTFFRKNIYDYLFGDKPISNVLKTISNIKTNFYIKVNQEDSYLGIKNSKYIENINNRFIFSNSYNTSTIKSVSSQNSYSKLNFNSKKTKNSKFNIIIQQHYRVNINDINSPSDKNYSFDSNQN